METMVSIAAVGLTAAVLGTVLRKSAPELALLLAAAAGVWMVCQTLEGLRAVAEMMGELAETCGLSEELLEPVAKAVALSILTRLSAEICRSAGESGLAAFVELGGTVAVLVTALPLMRAVTVLMAEMLR